jgi:hypothetical protein
MSDFYERVNGWRVELEFKPDCDEAIRRVYAWLDGELYDRPPIRFSRHNAEYEISAHESRWPTLRDRWFDTEYAVNSFIGGCQKRRFNAETFPTFWPNLGPNVFAACYDGVEYEFGETTAWTHSSGDGAYLNSFDYTPPSFNWGSEYREKLDEMTDYALSLAKGRFLVGYTDIHPGLDWAVAVRGNDALLYGMYEEPEGVAALARACDDDFLRFYGHYDAKLKAAGQLSVTWMNIPCYGRMHIPSCDFSNMISTEHFEKFAYSGLAKECANMTHNVFHVDGKGVARHTDAILTLPNLNAVQWVQGVGTDAPIMQWVPYIRKVQDAGKGVVVDVTADELDGFMEATNPEGLFLCIATESEEQELDIMRRTLTWGKG